MALEVVAIRRDGFNGDIELSLKNLPEGVTATGFKIPAGKNRGVVIVTAEQDAPRGFQFAKFVGTADINGQEVTRDCHLATMAWPVPNAWSEIPSPRLVESVPVSVSGSEFAAITFQAAAEQPIEVRQGQQVAIPLKHIRRGDFSGKSISLKNLWLRV